MTGTKMSRKRVLLRLELGLVKVLRPHWIGENVGWNEGRIEGREEKVETGDEDDEATCIRGGVAWSSSASGLSYPLSAFKFLLLSQQNRLEV